MPKTKSLDVFLSYARKDDEAFVSRLYTDLAMSGLRVWWDRVSMPSRGLTFSEEVRKAIDEADRFVLVVGPAAITSEYVRSEWKYALWFGRAVTPIIRLGEFGALPQELAPYHCLDFRGDDYDSALGSLLKELSRPLLAQAPFVTEVPSLPPHFLLREKPLAAIKALVMPDLREEPSGGSSSQVTAIHGMGGLGKSVIAAAFARAAETRRAFADGIIWLEFRRGESEADISDTLATALRRVVSGLGGESRTEEPESLRDRLAALLADKHYLFVLDNVSHIEHASAILNSLSPLSRILVTTREGDLIVALGAQSYPLGALERKETLQFVANWTGIGADELPAEALDIVEECGRLPLAIMLVAAQLAHGVSWADVLQALRDADLRFFEHISGSIIRSMRVSIDALSPSQAARYGELVAFSNEKLIPAVAVEHLWEYSGGLTPRNARKLISELSAKALLRVDTYEEARFVSLHDILYDFLLDTVTDRRQPHRQLVEAYATTCPLGWHTGPNDGYFLERIVFQLCAADRLDEAAQLVFKFEWLAVRLTRTGLTSLLAEFSLLADDAEAVRLRRALEQAAHILQANKSELASQLLGRLLSDYSFRTQRLLKQCAAWSARQWLRPHNQCLPAPSAALVRTLSGHTGSLIAAAISPDGSRAISASDDGTVRVWDIRTGEELKVLAQETGRDVSGVALSRGGSRAVTVSSSGAVSVYDTETGRPVRQFSVSESGTELFMLMNSGYTVAMNDQATLGVFGPGPQTSIWLLKGEKIAGLGYSKSFSVSSTGRWVLTVASANALIVDIATNKDYAADTSDCIAPPPEHRTLPPFRPYTQVHISDKQAIGVSAVCDGKITLWDLRTGLKCMDFAWDGDVPITSLRVTSDANRLVFTTDRYGLFVWDLGQGGGPRPVSTASSLNIRREVSVSHDGRTAITQGEDNGLKVWDLNVHEPPYSEDRASIDELAITSEGAFAATLHDHKHINVWRIADGQLLQTFQPGALTGAIALSDDASLTAAVHHDGDVTVWNTWTGDPVLEMDPGAPPWGGIAFGGDGATVLCACEDNSVKTWRISDGKLLASTPGIGGAAAPTLTLRDRSARKMPGIAALSGGMDELEMMFGVEILLSDLRFETTASMAISKGPAGALDVWHFAAGRVTRLIQPNDPEGGAYRAAISPNGRFAITANYHYLGTLAVWDLNTGGQLQRLKMNTAELFDVAITDDAKRAFVASRDGRLRVYDLASAGLLASFNSDRTLVRCAVAADGRTIVAGGHSGKPHILTFEDGSAT